MYIHINDLFKRWQDLRDKSGLIAPDTQLDAGLQKGQELVENVTVLPMG